MGRCTAACMLGGSPWSLTLHNNRGSVNLQDALIFTILWGEWHPWTQVGNEVTLDDRQDYEEYLAPAFETRRIQLVLDKAVSLAVEGSQPAVANRLYLRRMPEGVSNAVLAIEGLRRGMGFPENLVDWYVDFPKSQLNPPLQFEDTTRYFGIYVFLANENQKGQPDPATLVPNSNNFRTQNIKSGWLFFVPNSQFPLDKYSREPFGIKPNGDFDYDVPPPPPPGQPKVKFVIPIPINESFVILHPGDRYGALTGPNREVYFVNPGTNPALEQQVLKDFDLLPAAVQPANNIRLIKQGRDALVEIT